MSCAFCKAEKIIKGIIGTAIRMVVVQ